MSKLDHLIYITYSLRHLWLCSHGLESRSGRHFRTALSWFESLILAHVKAKLFQIRLLKHVLKCEKKGVLDRDLRRKPDSRTCERKALSKCDFARAFSKCTLKPCIRQFEVSRKHILSRTRNGQTDHLHFNKNTKQTHDQHWTRSLVVNFIPQRMFWDKRFLLQLSSESKLTLSG